MPVHERQGVRSWHDTAENSFVAWRDLQISKCPGVTPKADESGLFSEFELLDNKDGFLTLVDKYLRDGAVDFEPDVNQTLSAMFASAS